LLLIAVVSAFGFRGMAAKERQAREDGLKTSAKFAARTIASEIDLRFRALEWEASDDDLQQLMTKVNEAGLGARKKEEARADPSLPPLEIWLPKRFSKYARALKSDAWWISDRAGTLVALYGTTGVDPEKYMLTDLASRDFFHGQGKDLEKGVKGVPPTTHPHLTRAFRSNLDKKLKVAFSVPIQGRKRNSPILGVLAMSVAVHDFEVLQTGLQDKLIVLADTEPDRVDGEERQGLILHHKFMKDGGTSSLRLAEAVVDRCREEREHLDLHYRDPAEGDEGGTWLAAFERVVVKGRNDPVKGPGPEGWVTGWVVIVQQRP
jgi:hypothetical protein